MPENQTIDPRLGQDFGILHRSLVGDRVVGVARETLGHVQLVAVKVSRARKPGFVVEGGYVDHKRVFFPVAHRVSHISWIQIRGMALAVGGDDAEDMIRLVKDDRLSSRLHDLERNRDARYAGDAGHLTMHIRIGTIISGELVDFTHGPSLIWR